MPPLTIALLGAGNRGASAYGAYALRHPDEFRFMAVAETDPGRRETFALNHGITPERTFADWRELLAQPKLADALIVALQDKQHYEPAMAAMALGYDLLMEKPMSPDPWECQALAAEAGKRQRLMLVAHVLRYTPFFTTIKNLIEAGEIGRIISIQHNENVGYWHMAHSYVRGNWRSAAESSPMLLAKSCHDLDLLLWLLDTDCKKVSSFGSLMYFRPENAPFGAAPHCLANCPAEPTCPFSARRLYLGGNTGWPVSVISQDPSLEARTNALVEGPYGRCVFACDNNVVDHQVVAMEFMSGATAAFTMCGLTQEISRTIKIMGSAGEIRGHMEKNEISLSTYADERVTTMRPSGVGSGHHAGGDEGLMRAFGAALRGGRNQAALSSAQVSVRGHLLAFAAEEARLKGTVVTMDDFAARLQKEHRV